MPVMQEALSFQLTLLNSRMALRSKLFSGIKSCCFFFLYITFSLKNVSKEQVIAWHMPL